MNKYKNSSFQTGVSILNSERYNYLPVEERKAWNRLLNVVKPFNNYLMTNVTVNDVLEFVYPISNIETENHIQSQTTNSDKTEYLGAYSLGKQLKE